MARRTFLLPACALLALALCSSVAWADNDEDEVTSVCKSNEYRWACDACKVLPNDVTRWDSRQDCRRCVRQSVKNDLNVEWACAKCGDGESGNNCRECIRKTGPNNVDACLSCQALNDYYSDEDACYRCVKKLGPLGTGVAYSCDDCGSSNSASNNKCRKCLVNNPEKAWACLQCNGDENFNACVFCKGKDFEKCYACRTGGGDYDTCMKKP